MITESDLHQISLAAIFSFLGLVIFVLGFYTLDKLTPGNLWHEIIEEHNVALAVVVGACALGISLIIAAALLG
ncbi:MAG: DUF350 domain-containing protein [Silvanigrellales bacterium]|jgi:uncharacterized membrane protein YjfL (UPF0719 family)|nr:DUF350 domain-containing protein [Silvanigrellales bacterium]